MREIAAVWVTLTAVLTYLDVPIQNGPLFAANLILQASLGVITMVAFARNLTPSLLLLCGPGLILGGALSFGIFQVVGRGTVGLVVVGATGLLATFQLIAIRSETPTTDSSWWTLSQLVGMATVAMSYEFSEVVPLALTLFAIGLAHQKIGQLRLRWLLLLFSSCMSLILYLRSLWSEHWWLITDDYQLFEVISTHLTQRGPLADWGVTSFARYHWMSYGWAGQLDLASGNPAPFLTLSLVMPFVYSFALAASLALVYKMFQGPKFLALGLSPVWATVAVIRLDWSGTSTAGNYAVLAAACYMSMHSAQQRKSVRAHFLLVAFGLILLLTKITSIFPLMLLAIYIILSTVHFRTSKPALQLLYRVLISLLILFGLFGLIWITSHLLDRSFKFVTVNENLGQIAWFGPLFAGFLTALQQAWLWMAVLMLFVSRTFTRHNDRPESQDGFWFGWLSLSCVISGVILDVSVTANSDNHRYLSGPFYFIAALSLLAPVTEKVAFPRKTESQAAVFGMLATIVLIGFTWSQGNLNARLLDAIGNRLNAGPLLPIELIKFVTADSRFGAVVVSAILLIVLILKKQSPIGLIAAFAIALPLLTLFENGSNSGSSFSKEPSSDEITTYLGSKAERQVGEWLSQNVGAGELIATNRLFGESGGTVSDLALAVWSGREFLVLGPSLGDRQTVRRTEAIRLSINFAEEPSRENCDRLEAAGVVWFVIDTMLTNRRNWSNCAEVRYQYDNLTVLRLFAE